MYYSLKNIFQIIIHFVKIAMILPDCPTNLNSIWLKIARRDRQADVRPTGAPVDHQAGIYSITHSKSSPARPQSIEQQGSRH